MKPLLKNRTILMMGAPGTGKGSYSKKISKRFGIPVYSSGDHLRKIISEPETQDNRELIEILGDKFQIPNVPQYFESVLNKGELLRKEIISMIVFFTLEQTKKTEHNSIILDGYPRTLHQALEFDVAFKRPIDLVINVEQDTDIIIKKLLGRRNCNSCGAGFNVTDINEKGYVMPSLKPKVEDICDVCGGKLTMRADDTEEVISSRLKIYAEKSQDILDYYKNKNVLSTVEMKRGFDDISKLYDLVEDKLIKNI